MSSQPLDIDPKVISRYLGSATIALQTDILVQDTDAPLPCFYPLQHRPVFQPLSKSPPWTNTFTLIHTFDSPAISMEAQDDNIMYESGSN